MADIDWLAQVRAQKVIAVIRTDHLELGVEMAKAVAAGGMRLIEVTWNSREPTQLLDVLQTELPNCVIGAGTLLTLDNMQTAITAGAKFLFTPHTDLALIKTAANHQIPIIPGALTPSEIVAAWQAGATCVKVFPIQSVGGADYIRHLQGPLGQIPLIPTGGVTLENAKTFLDAGAVAVGLAGQLFPKAALLSRDWLEIRHRAKCLLEQLKATDAGAQDRVGE